TGSCVSNGRTDRKGHLRRSTSSRRRTNDVGRRYIADGRFRLHVGPNIDAAFLGQLFVELTFTGALRSGHGDSEVDDLVAGGFAGQAAAFQAQALTTR